MKTHAILALATAAILATGPAPARTIDLARATCAEYAALQDLEKEQILLWLAGYYAGAAQRPSIDTDQLAASTKALAELCAKTPAAPLIGQEVRPLLLAPPAP